MAGSVGEGVGVERFGSSFESRNTGRFIMLVLSRKESQRIQLGDSIVLTIVRVNGDRVRVGIEAPAEVQVRRGELQPHAPPAAGVPAAGGTSNAADRYSTRLNCTLRTARDAPRRAGRWTRSSRGGSRGLSEARRRPGRCRGAESARPGR